MADRMALILLVAALLFAVVTGANDGASLIATNLSSKAVSPLGALCALALAVTAGPLIVGTAVATTFARGLVSFGAQGGESALLIAVFVAMALVMAISRLGLPTSVTQATLGAIVGVGVGRGLPVAWDSVGRALLVFALAPLAAGLLASLVARGFAVVRVSRPARSQMRALHAASFGAQCLGYAANDAQKMVAVMAIATGAVGVGVAARLDTQALIGLCFFGGTLLGISRLGVRLGTQLMPVRPMNAISAGFASSAAVLASAAIGSPVSMAQSSSAALIGSEFVLESYRRVRWNQAARIAAVWVTTLPTAIVVAALAGAATR